LFCHPFLASAHDLKIFRVSVFQASVLNLENFIL